MNNFSIAGLLEPPTFDVDFRYLSSLPSFLTFTRSSGAVRTNSSGLLELLSGNDIPRFTYDPISLLPIGILKEDTRTNSFLNATLDGANLATQNVTVTAVPWTVSFYGTGTITFSGAYAGAPLVGSGAYPTRSSVTFTPSAGTLTCTVTGTVKFAQCELGTYATSFIPTAGVAATRAGETLSLAGAEFSSRININEGTVVVQYLREDITTALLSISDGTLNNRFQPRCVQPNGEGSVIYRSSAVVNDSGNTSASFLTAVGSVGKVSACYSSTNAAISSKGSPVVSTAAASLPVSPNVLYLGGGGTGLGYTILQFVRYYNKRYSDAILQALST